MGKSDWARASHFLARAQGTGQTWGTGELARAQMRARADEKPCPPREAENREFCFFFHTFFVFSSHMRPTTYPKVMIFYLKGNSMFLNTFLTILSCQNDFYGLSASRNQICSTKKRQKKRIFLYVFCAFFVEQF